MTALRVSAITGEGLSELRAAIRAAIHALDELVGGIDVDEVMGRVFRTFCVGK